MNPATFNFRTYYGNTFGFAFILHDSEGDPLDMNLFSDLSMRVFRGGRENDPIFTPELSISANQVTGALTSKETESISGMVAYYELNAMRHGKAITLVNGRVMSSRASTGGTQQGADLNVTVNIETLEVSLSVADSAALSLQALSQIETLTGQAQTARDQAQQSASQAQGYSEAAQSASDSAAQSATTASDSASEAEGYRDEIQALSAQIDALLAAVQTDPYLHYLYRVNLDGGVVISPTAVRNYYSNFTGQ